MTAIDTLIHFDFARQALIAGIAVGTLCSLLSVIVVLKRMAFIGQGISHAGFGGVGTAVLLGLVGLPQDLVIFVFCLATALLIGILSRRRNVEMDSAIGILLVAAMGWGVAMTQVRGVLVRWPWYAEHFGATTATGSFELLLAGSLLDVGRTQMWFAVVASVVVIGICAALFKEILFFTFDETVSRVFGVPTRFIYYLLLVLLSLTTVLSIRLMGFVLVTALLVMPAATALLLSQRLGLVLLLSWIVGMVGVIGGLLVSLQIGDLSAGPCIVGVLSVCFAAAYAVKALRGWRQRRQGAALAA
jgi:ABC-type Mn2+/Zn2+ transport system permease subunit